MSLNFEILEIVEVFLCSVFRHGFFGLSKMSLKIEIVDVN